MEQALPAILQWAGSAGIGPLLLLVGVWWLNNANKQAAADSKVAWDALSTERTARLDGLLTNMQVLTERVNACEADRSELWGKVVDLAKHQAP